MRHRGNGHRILTGLLAALLAVVLVPAIAKAAELPEGGVINTGGTYTLNDDVTTTIKVSEDVTATINLNGHNIKPETGDAIVNEGTLTIEGSGEVAATSTGSAAIANLPDATATVKGGTYSSAQWYVIKNLGTMTIDGAVNVNGTEGNVSSLIDNGWYGSSDKVAGGQYAAQDSKASLTIESGDFVGKSGDKSCSVVKNDDYGTLVINGGTFDSTANDATENATTILNWNVATINGGTFKGSYCLSNGSYGADSADKGELTVNGGTFTNSSEVALGKARDEKAGKLTITNGSFDKQIVAQPYEIVITGGQFANDVSEFVPEGYTCTKTDNAVYTVTKTKTTPDTPDKPDTPDTPDTPSDDVTLVSVYRLYNPYSGEHLFTLDKSEYDYLATIGWRQENIAWQAPEKSDSPVYRLYNPYSGDHHYTLDKEEHDYLVTLGWKSEGISFYSVDKDAKGAEPVYRLFNQWLTQGTHLFTRDKDEYDYLATLGWRQEGVAFYAYAPEAKTAE